MKEVRRDQFKALGIAALMVLLVGSLYIFYDIWTARRDSMLKQIEQNEAKASFKAQIVTTDNGKRIFIWEVDGKINGQIVDEDR